MCVCVCVQANLGLTGIWLGNVLALALGGTLSFAYVMFKLDWEEVRAVWP